MQASIFILLGLLFLIAGSASAYDDGDFQLWNTGAEVFNLSKDSKITME